MFAAKNVHDAPPGQSAVSTLRVRLGSDAAWAKSARAVSGTTTDVIACDRTVEDDRVHLRDMRPVSRHFDVRGTVMTSIYSSRRQPTSSRRGVALAAALAAIVGGAILFVSACADVPSSPAQRQLTAGSARAVVAKNHLPFSMTQSWKPSDNDFTTTCDAVVPDPAHPGSWLHIPISGLLHSSGTATHFGHYTAENTITECPWNSDSAAIQFRGDFRIRVANGDSVVGKLVGYARFTLTGSDFAGTLSLTGGTGRFQSATGVATLNSHDEPDGSGTGWGSGWISY